MNKIIIIILAICFGSLNSICQEQNADVLNRLSKRAIAYAQKGDMGKAAQILLDCYNKSLLLEDKELQGRLANNVGNVFLAVNDLKNTKKYYQKALQIRLYSEDFSGSIDSYINLSALYIKMGDLNIGLDNLNMGLHLAQKIGDSIKLGAIYHNMGSIYGRLKKTDLALVNYLKSLDLTDIRDPSLKIQTLINLGDVYGEQGQYEKALPYLEEAKEYVEANNIKYLQKKNYRAFIRHYYAIGNIDSVMEYMDKLTFINDSLYAMDLIQAVENAEIKYSTLEKDKELAELRYRETQSVLRDKESKIRLIILGVSLVVIILLLALRLAVVRLRKDRQKNLFMRQRIILEQKALRAQMNPHFTFNALNSIQNLITSNKNKEATIYLSAFSKLMRLALDASMNNRIKLSNEIAIVEKYLTLEKLRFKENLDWEIQYDKGLSDENTYVPAMFLQPIIENAILHGVLKGKSENGKIRIKVQLTGKTQLFIYILNSGAELTSARNRSADFGDGLTIVHQRITGLHSSNYITLEPLEDHDEFVTRVTILLNKIGENEKFNFT